VILIFIKNAKHALVKVNKNHLDSRATIKSSRNFTWLLLTLILHNREKKYEAARESC